MLRASVSCRTRQRLRRVHRGGALPAQLARLQCDARTGVEPNVELEAVDQKRVLEVPLVHNQTLSSIRSEYPEYPETPPVPLYVRDRPAARQAARSCLYVVCRCGLAHRARCAVRCTLSAVGSIGHLAYERVSVGNDLRRIRQDLCDAID